LIKTLSLPITTPERALAEKRTPERIIRLQSIGKPDLKFMITPDGNGLYFLLKIVPGYDRKLKEIMLLLQLKKVLYCSPGQCCVKTMDDRRDGMGGNGF
jgi:hypothetical protein